MKTLFKTAMAGMFGLLALGATAAFAGYKPDYCDNDHDHRAHNANYYDYYAKDRYYKAGAYRDSGVRFSITLGDRYNDRDYRRGSYDRRHNYNNRRQNRRVVNRDTFDTRYRARIVLIEEVVYRRKGPRLVCTVQARGPEARYVSKRRINRIAERNCSPRARVRVST